MTKSVSPKETIQKAQQRNSTIELGASNPPLQVSPSTFIKIDHATLFDSIAIVSGWASANTEVKFDDVLETHYISRPDADSAINRPTIGFISVIEATTALTALNCHLIADNTNVTLPIRLSTTAEEVAASLSYFGQRGGRLMSHYTKSHLLRKYFAKNCQELPQAMRANKLGGHLDICKTFPGFGYVAYGWALKREPAELWLVTGNGDWHPLNQSVRFARPDVAQAFSETFGTYAAESGFFCVVKNENIEQNTSIRLIAVLDEGIFLVHESVADHGPQTPLSYAKWAFSLSTPGSKFFNRLDSQEGELIENLIARNRAGYPDEFEVWRTEEQPHSPMVSVIVPLFGRSDFVEYQLTHFAQDPDFTNGTAELIYVIDDPALVEPILQSYHQLFKLYKVPFQLIWGKVNRGYSGANNLGLKIARGNTVLLLNSDVFPIHNGWVSRMKAELLSDETIGAVGARLDFADGSVQHQGMFFEYSAELGVWLNEHPMRGFDVPIKNETYDVEAATGACLALRREDLVAVGGMDEGFLIGDFEDSDLCLKLRNLRGRIVIAGGTRLVHLERQSFTNLGSSDFRTKVVKFNAWRHNRLWSTTIEAMKEKF